MFSSLSFFFFFFFNDTATTEIYTLSLHDALPIYMPSSNEQSSAIRRPWYLTVVAAVLLLWGAGMSCYFLPGTVKALDRKSTRLNSSHGYISYAVFCLKKKKKITTIATVSDASPAC